MVHTYTVALLLGLSAFRGMLCAPLGDASPALDTFNSTSLGFFARATPSPPHFVIYSDRRVSGLTGPPPVAQVKGYNVFALSFLLTEGAFDKAEEWTQLSSSQRSSIKSQYAAAGIKLIVSLFGATDAPTSNGADPIATANTMAAWVKQFNLDGVDVDYEDFDAINVGDGKAEAWLASFTRQLRVQLPQGTYILTHAPVAPWFSPNKFGGGAYLQVHSAVGSLIDWYNVQFYNQGSNEYTSCAGLLTTSSNTWPRSALFQIAASGIPLSKLVIGKPATSGDASNGFMSTSTLAGCVQQAKSQGWNAGVMVWEFPSAAAAWIQSVRSLAFPE
ncbi:Basic endochitinase [Hypsizygus marmoreus]|uniref:chitinase n=1 Tax=Hypsizygus marmoreus TaxID=39966 RepID=A0A369JHN3_HYPMA|nr:Basic endochitinase [Hypsizygus marmoreus]